MRINENDNPRGAHLMAVIKDYSIRRRQENELNAFIDRGLDTEARFGTFREFQRTVEILLTTGTFVAYRTRMNLLISQYMLLRSEDRRHADLCDLVAVESLNEAGFQKKYTNVGFALASGQGFYLFLFTFLMCRQIKKKMHNMPVLFGIKPLNYAQLAFLLFTYICGSMLR